MNPAQSTSLAFQRRLLLLACVVLVYAIHFWPSPSLRDAAMHSLGFPAYKGFEGLFVPHLLLYSTLAAVCGAVLWSLLARYGLVPAPSLHRPDRYQLMLGIRGGLVALAFSLLFVGLVFPSNLGWMGLDGWKVAGNLFSNFYEEFLYRGFFLVVLTAVFGFWPAAIISSAMWAYTHNQYPIPLQALIAVVGIYFSWLVRRARSLWTPYTSHMVLDVVADSIVG